MRKLVRLALVASVLYGTGAHWAALQTYAWAAMSMAGQADPCRVCRIVERGSAVKQAPVILRAGAALDLAVPVAPRLTAALAASAPAVSPFRSVRSPSARPFVPPPKPSLA